MGLNAEATRDVEALIASGDQAVATLTWVSAVVLVLGGIGMASTLSTWYHRMYDRTPPKGVMKHLVYQAAGVGAFADSSCRGRQAHSMSSRIFPKFFDPRGRPERRPASCGGGTPRGG